MIQRIQSIYLFLSAAAAGLFSFLPLGTDETPDPDLQITASLFLPLLIIGIVVAVFSLLNIFLFKNRTLQMNVCRLALVLTVALVGLGAYFLYFNTGSRIELPGVGVIMPLFTLVFSFLALKKIGADEKLVRSADRLR